MNTYKPISQKFKQMVTVSMINANYVVLISNAPASSFEVFSVSDVEPTDHQLKAIWIDQGLNDYRQYSDLIEVFESTQLAEAFLGCTNNIEIGQVLTPNPMSNQDAINAYFP